MGQGPEKKKSRYIASMAGTSGMGDVGNRRTGRLSTRTGAESRGIEGSEVVNGPGESSAIGIG